ncbi:MAG TPA: acyltransferase [Acidobacteriaceae bacterium]|nr:acyltransferase [Acidobacteriaceae bacterium]
MPAALHPQPDSSTTGRHIPALDGVRGIAVILVLICHLFWSDGAPAGGHLLHFVAQFRAAGWVGVDLFFVLSGFLITGILYDTLPARHFFRNFYARRILRIFPLYYGVFALLLLITSILGEHWSRSLFSYLTYTDNLHIKIHIPPTNAPWVNINHFWSLMVEEQFYLCWPLLVFLLRSRRRIAIAAILGALASLAVRLTLVHIGLSAHAPFLLYSWTPSCLDGLFLGALLAMAVRSRLRDRVLALSLPVLLACAAVIAALWYTHSGFEPDHSTVVATWGTFVLVIGFTAFTAATLRAGTLSQKAASDPTLRFFGRYSYGLYVYHYTIAGLINGHLRPILLAHTGSKFLSVLIPGLIALALSVAVAWLSFTFYESRFLLLKKRFHDHSRRPKLHEFVAEPPALH